MEPSVQFVQVRPMRWLEFWYAGEGTSIAASMQHSTSIGMVGSFGKLP